jgi:hypothetical protein
MFFDSTSKRKLCFTHKKNKMYNSEKGKKTLNLQVFFATINQNLKMCIGMIFLKLH